MPKLISRQILLFIAYVFITNQAGANENYELAINAYEQNDLDASYIYLKSALVEDETHLPSKILIADILIGRGFVHQAIMELEDAIQMGVDKNLVVTSLIQSYLKTQNIDALFAIDSFDLNKDNYTELMLAKAYFFQKQGLLNKAEEALLDLVVSEHQPLRVRASLASFYIDTKKFEEAKAQLDRLSIINPNSSVYYHLTAKWYAKTNNARNAIKNYKQALELAPSDPMIKRGLASEFMKVSDFGNAQALIQDILIQTPDDPYALLFQARIHASNQANAQAEDIFEAINQKIEIFSNDVVERNASLQLILGMTNFLKGDLQEAAVSIERYLSKSEANINALSILSEIYIELGESRRAQTVLDRNYDLSSNNIALGSLLCELYIEANKHFKCEQLLGQLKFKFPGSQNLPIIEVKLLQAQGDVNEALIKLESIQNTVTSNNDFSLLYLTLLRQSGKEARALEYVEELINEQPENLGFKAIKTDLLITKSKFESASRINELLLDNNPKSITASLNQAQILLAQQRPKDAQVILERILKDSPSHYEASLLLAAIKSNNTSIEEAESILKNLIATYRNRSRPLTLLTALYVKDNQTEQALSIVNKLNRDFFLNPEFIKLKADIHQILRQTAEVNKQYNLLLGLAEDDFTQLIQVASLQSKAGLVKEAIDTLERALKIEDDNYAKKELLRLSLGIRDTKRINELLSDLLANYPNDLSIILLQGDAKLLIENKPRQAAKLFEKVLKSMPTNAEAAAKLYQIQIDHIDELSSNFESQMRSSLELDSQLFLHRNLLADYLLLKGQSEQAKQHYEFLIEANAPNVADNLNNLANIHAENLDFESSKRLAQRALAIDGEASHIKNTLGFALTALGEHGEALAMLRQAFSTNSQSPYVRVNLANILHIMKRHDEALSILQAIDIDTIPNKLKNRLKALQSKISTEQKVANAI